MTLTVPQPGNLHEPLPPLRDDLQLVPGSPTQDGESSWTLIDPVRHRFFHIGWTPYQFLSRWGLGTSQAVLDAVAQDTTCQAGREDLEQLLVFLYSNNLTRDPAQTNPARWYEAQAQRLDRSWFSTLVHHYLFFKVPLLHPHRFLVATLPLVAPFYTTAMRYAVILVGLTGLYLVGRQWDSFLDTFLHFFSAQGMLWYGLALFGVKLAHELGHAYTATRFGCRVPTMGVAFLVMFPMLYTDTSGAWQLTSRRQRCLIGTAGVITELSLAAFATLLWSFLEDGTLRSLAFVVATTGWIMGLSINLNPFMRFDGYYVLSDWLRIPNLQDRAFALGIWQLRRVLFGLPDPPPESFSPSMRRTVTLYAWSVWIYRVILFTGIALLVYHFAFKALGVILFGIEIGWFILLPILRELRTWWKFRSRLRGTLRPWALGAALALVLGAITMPWPTRVSLPAILEAYPYATVFAPAPGRITQVLVRNGQLVEEGAVLLKLEAPSVARDIRLTQQRLLILTQRARQQVGNPEELAKNFVVQESYRTRLSELEGLRAQQDTLILRAPIAGLVTDIADSLRPGRWINESLPIAFIIAPRVREIEALAPEADLSRLAIGQSAVFVPDDPTQTTLAATVREIHQIDEGNFTLPYLASVFGGSVAVREDQQGRLKPESSVYRIRLTLEDQRPEWRQVTRGRLHVSGQPASMVHRAWTHAASVFIRESGL